MEDPSSIYDTAFWLTAGSIVVLLMFSGFFSGSETALTAASRGKLRSQADKGSPGAERALEITEDSERLIGSVLLGNNLVNILAASLATSLFTKAFGESGVALATLVMNLLVLIFAEVLPKTYAITNSERAASMVSWPISIVVIHAKDLLRAVDKTLRGPDGIEGDLADFDIMEVARKPYFVPETTALDDQMRQFLRLHTHFALVVDEYGALQGLITLEDILEEIVGEITDEFDEAEVKALQPESDGSYRIEGAMTIRDLNRMADWSLPDDEANTVAGLVIHEAQSIPTVGQVFSFHGFRFEVVERDKNRLTTLKVRPL